MGCLDCKQCTHKPKTVDKWRYTLYTTVLFIIIVNPYTYRLTNTIFGKIIGKVASADGCPTIVGIMLHTIVFTLLLRILMDLDI